MKIAALNGYEVHLPTSGGKAGKGKAKSGSIQVRRDSCIVKQFRFRWADKASRLNAIRAARKFMLTEGLPLP